MSHAERRAGPAPLPRWIVLWLAISAAVVVWDALFVLSRPASLPGGALSWLWIPYRLYVQIDHRYGDLTDGFVIAQSLVNFVEAALGLAACWLSLRRRPAAVLLAYTVSVMTLSKTVLYFLLDAVSGFAATRHNALVPLVLFYVSSNGVWIVMPAAVVRSLGRRLLTAAHSAAAPPPG